MNFKLLILGVEERSGNFLTNDAHDCEYGNHNAPVSDDEEIVKDNEQVCGHVHHMVKRLNDLTIEKFHVSCEDCQDLSNRCHIKEGVNWCMQDLSQSILMDSPSNHLLHSLEDEIANISKDQTKHSNKC